MTAAGIGALFGGIAALVWPLLILALIVVMRPQIRAIAESVGKRGGSVKLAGFEVTIAEATEQQQALIADLQIQLGHLQNRLDGAPMPTPAPPTSVSTPPTSEPDADDVGAIGPIPGAHSIDLPASIVAAREPPRDLRIVWVDGHPESSAALLSALEKWGVQLTKVTSVAAALEHVANHVAAILVSRMSIGGEAGAGVDLARRVHGLDPLATVAILGTDQAVARRGHEALVAGAAFVTASPAELIRYLARVAASSSALQGESAPPT